MAAGSRSTSRPVSSGALNPSHMNRQATAFVATTTAIALALVYWLPADGFAGLGLKHALGLLSFVAVGILSEAMAIDFGGGRQASSSLAYLPFLACIVVFSPALSLVAITTVVFVSRFLLSKQQLAKALFNVSQAVIAAFVAGQVYSIFLPTSVAVSPLRTQISYLGFPFLAASFFLSNILLSGFAIALLQARPILPVLNQVIGPRGGNLWNDMLASPIALVAAALYDSIFITGVFVIVLPLQLIRSSYLSKLQLIEANQDLLRVLVMAIETRDPYTSGHSLRVATLAGLIAKDLGLSAKTVGDVEMAALLHDIGKIDVVYATIIRKPYDLNDEERTLIRTHATKGAELLEQLSSVPKDVVKAVLHHHERYDGTGYPSGMRGNEIPLAARVIMLCDSVDAMLSDRPYRRALSISKVRAELIRCSGTQFDPSIVRTILDNETMERAGRLVRTTGQPGPMLVEEVPTAS